MKTLQIIQGAKVLMHESGNELEARFNMAEGSIFLCQDKLGGSSPSKDYLKLGYYYSWRSSRVNISDDPYNQILDFLKTFICEYRYESFFESIEFDNTLMLSEELMKITSRVDGLGRIMDVKEYGVAHSGFNFVDIAIDNKKMLSYIPASRLQHFKIEFQYTAEEVNAIICGRTNMILSPDDTGLKVEYYDVWNKELRKKYAVMAKPGKVFKQILPDIDNKILADITDMIKRKYASCDSNVFFEAIELNDILYSYDIKNYDDMEDDNDSLHGSCMASSRKNKRMRWYYYIGAKVLTIFNNASEKRVRGRAILWNDIKAIDYDCYMDVKNRLESGRMDVDEAFSELNIINIPAFVDRVYHILEDDRINIIQYAENKKYSYRLKSGNCNRSNLYPVMLWNEEKQEYENKNLILFKQINIEDFENIYEEKYDIAYNDTLFSLHINKSNGVGFVSNIEYDAIEFITKHIIESDNEFKDKYMENPMIGMLWEHSDDSSVEFAYLNLFYVENRNIICLRNLTIEIDGKRYYKYDCVSDFITSDMILKENAIRVLVMYRNGTYKYIDKRNSDSDNVILLTDGKYKGEYALRSEVTETYKGKKVMVAEAVLTSDGEIALKKNVIKIIYMSKELIMLRDTFVKGMILAGFTSKINRIGITLKMDSVKAIECEVPIVDESDNEDEEVA